MSAFHWARIQAMGLAVRFDAIYLSHEIGCLKPAAEAFRLALDGMALPPGEVLFLDDGAVNVEAARDLGIEFIAPLARWTGPCGRRLPAP